MSRLVRVHVEIDVTISVDDPVMRSAETQVADFILPALRDLEEETEDVKSVSYKFTEIQSTKGTPRSIRGVPPYGQFRVYAGYGRVWARPSVQFKE